MILESDSGPCVSANHLVDSFLAAAGLGAPAGPVELTRPSSSPRGAAESRESPRPAACREGFSALLGF